MRVKQWLIKKEILLDFDEYKKKIWQIFHHLLIVHGDIIFGVEEDAIDKIPTNIIGIPYENDKKIILQIKIYSVVLYVLIEMRN